MNKGTLILNGINYSGGTIENNFIIDKSNRYSLEEQKVGRWVDNKPLYQKSIYIDELPNKNVKAYPLNIENLEKVHNVWGVYSMQNNYALPINIGPEQSWDGTIRTLIRGQDLVIQTLSDRSAYKDSYVTIQYTKTTDTPGEDTEIDISDLNKVHYDNTEREIGTWFGEKLYQKTIITQITTTQKEEFQSIDISFLNYKNIINIEGIYSFNNDTFFRPISYNRGLANEIFYWFINESIFYYSILDNSINSGILSLTIKYTKND